MRQWFKALLVSTSLSAFVPSAMPAFAQATAPSAGGDASALEVDGVKLGMTPAQTIAALKAFDPTIMITDNTGDPKDHLGTTFWDSSFGILAISEDYADASRIENTAENAYGACIQRASKALQGMPIPQSQIDQCQTEQKNDDIDYDSKLKTILNNPRFIYVWFSPVPGNVKAIAVSSSTVFIKTIPTVANVIQALHKKYPDPDSGEIKNPDGNSFHYAQDEDGLEDSEMIYWYYDPRGRIRPPESAKDIGTTIMSAGSMTGYNIASLSLLNPRIYQNAPPGAIAGNGVVNTPLQPDIFLPNSVNEGNGTQLIALTFGDASVDGDTAWLGEAKTDPATDNLVPQAVTNPLLATIVDISLFDSKGIYKYRQEASTYLNSQQNQQNQGNASGFQGNSPNL